ncbi:hypothetical protein D3C87_324130 [compost metagenome]
MVIMQMATGDYLDHFGNLYNLFRENGESDDIYRKRILNSFETMRRRVEQEHRLWNWNIFNGQ